MHHLRTLAACAFATLLVACASEPAVAPPAVHAEGRTRMPVVGLQGWQQGRVVRYGEFSTSPVGAPSVSQKVTPCPAGCSTLEAGAVRRAFDSTARSSASSLSFTQFGPGERSVRVHVTLSAQAQNAGWATTLFGVPVDGGGGRVVTSEFAGLVEAADGSRPAWRFALLQDTRTDGVDRPAGWARDDAGHRVVLRHAAAPAGTPDVVAKASRGMGPGLLFELDGQVVGGVDRIAHEVWLRDDLPPEMRLTLAGLSTAVLLRPQS